MSSGYGYKAAHSFTHTLRPILVSQTRCGRLGELPQGSERLVAHCVYLRFPILRLTMGQ